MKHFNLILLFIFFNIFLLQGSENFLEVIQQKIGGSLLLDDSITLTLDFNGDDQDYKTLLKDLPESFIVKNITFTCDVYIDDFERDYILGFTQESVVSIQNLIDAFSHLKMKNKFSQLNVEFEPCEDGIIIHCDLIGLWTFNKVVIQGLLNGGQKYSHYYLLEFGELFDNEKHNHSIEKIKEILKSEGYCNNNILDYLQYDQKTKTVTVILVIDMGYKFVIDEVTLHVTSSDSDANSESLLTKKLEKFFVPRLKGLYYNQILLNNETNFLKNYLAKKGYLNPRIKLVKDFDVHRDALSLSFTITVNQKKSFSFFGNHFFSNKELFDLIFAYGRSVAHLPDSFLSQEIIDVYQKKGFWEIQVDCKHEEKRNFFLIKEGSRAVITALDIQGVVQGTMPVLRKYFSPLIKAAFDEDLVRQALQKVVNYYLKEGFLDIKIINQEYIPINNSKNYTLIITIHEGERRFVKSVMIDQFPDLAQQGPFGDMNGSSAIPFDINQIQVQRQWLMSYFQQQGYLYVDVVHEIQHEDNLVSIIWKISGIDRKVTFGKTIILGSHTFPFENILRELSFKEGDLWQKEKLENSIKKLQRLGIFEHIYMYPYNISQQEDQKIIFLKLLEDEPFEFRARAGFQQVSKTLLEFRKGTTYKLGGTMLYKNPFNVGDLFCVDTDFTRFYRNVFVEYRRPWIFSLPLNLIIRGYSNKYIQPVVMGSDKPLYQAIQQGFLISVNRCCGHVNFGCNVGLEIMETNHLSIDMARAINFESILIDKKVPYLYSEPNCVIDYLDNDVNPTTGFLTVVSCRAMMPLRSISTTYVKILIEESMFFPLNFISSVLGVRFRAGHIFNREFNNIMPPERFYLGGQNSLRSYEPDRGPPLGSFIEDNGKRVLAPQGGKSMVNMNFEIRFPLFWNIGGVVFQDFGVLADHSITEVIRSHLLAGTGFGLRYYTPVGPLRFDIGWKWKKYAPEEARYAWFLTLGHAF